MTWPVLEEQHSWANLPNELLGEILRRIDDSEHSWPRRKSVVACAQVCRTWRQVANDVVKPVHISSRITFPDSLKQPGPRDRLMQCYIKRNPHTRSFRLYLSLCSDALVHYGKFLLAARKCGRATCTDYIISTDPHDTSKGSNSSVGRLRSNFLRTKFTVYDNHQPHAGRGNSAKKRSIRLVNLKQVCPRAPAGNYPVAHISYELNMLGNRGPRRMHCVMDSIPASAMEPGVVPSFPVFQSKSTQVKKSLAGPECNKKDDALVLKNKTPRWHDRLECWCLNFNGRVTIASVKNFQLAAASPGIKPAGSEDDNIILQFGKVDQDTFTMDYGYPLSAFQAFAICLSSFDTKIACE